MNNTQIIRGRLYITYNVRNCKLNVNTYDVDRKKYYGFISIPLVTPSHILLNNKIKYTIFSYYLRKLIKFLSVYKSHQRHINHGIHLRVQISPWYKQDVYGATLSEFAIECSLFFYYFSSSNRYECKMYKEAFLFRFFSGPLFTPATWRKKLFLFQRQVTLSYLTGVSGKNEHTQD